MSTSGTTNYNNLTNKPTINGVTVQGSLTTGDLLITAADWAISQKFVPYCPSMQEMYQMILALQNGTRSAPALAKAEPETGEEEMR